jgi:hypothetical protein
MRLLFFPIVHALWEMEVKFQFFKHSGQSFEIMYTISDEYK